MPYIINSLTLINVHLTLKTSLKVYKGYLTGNHQVTQVT